MAHEAIVVAVPRGIAPAIGWMHGVDGYACARAACPIGSIMDSADAPAAHRRCPIALALMGPRPAAAECAGKAEGTKDNEPAGRAGRPGQHADRWGAFPPRMLRSYGHNSCF